MHPKLIKIVRTLNDKAVEETKPTEVVVVKEE